MKIPDSGKSILQEAIEVTEQRQVVYDKPEQNMDRIKELWNAYLKTRGIDIQLESTDVAMMNILQKIAREVWKHKRDNWVDIAGYAHVGYRSKTSQE